MTFSPWKEHGSGKIASESIIVGRLQTAPHHNQSTCRSPLEASKSLLSPRTVKGLLLTRFEFLYSGKLPDYPSVPNHESFLSRESWTHFAGCFGSWPPRGSLVMRRWQKVEHEQFLHRWSSMLKSQNKKKLVQLRDRPACHESNRNVSERIV